MLFALSRNPFFSRAIRLLCVDLLSVGLCTLAIWYLAGVTRLEPRSFGQIAFACTLVPILTLAARRRVDRAAAAGVAHTAAASATMGFLLALAIAALNGAGLAAVTPAIGMAALGFAICTAMHLGFERLEARFEQRVVIVGASDLGVAIAREIGERAGLGLRLVGFLSDEDRDALFTEDDVSILGPVHHLVKVVDELKVNRVVVASKSRSELFPAEELLTLKTHGLNVESGVQFYERLTGKIYTRDLRPSYLVFADGFRIGLAARAAKRAIDIAVAGLGLILASPLLALSALAIKLDSRGPVLFRQRRVGLRGKLFPITKLRTMTHDAESKSGPTFARRGDVRITRVGRFLRRSRLDEVPQLWNVLRGDMTLVGPRPERPEFLDSLIRDFGYFRLRTAMRPGLTGWAQVNNGYAAEAAHFEEKLSYDLFYMKHRSLWLDLIVMLRTIREMILFKGV